MSKLIFRICLFFFVLYFYVFDRELLNIVGIRNIKSLRPLHVVWVILMLEMITQIIPTSKITMGCLKQFKSKYLPPEESYNKLGLYKNVQQMNISAMKVLVSWILLNAIIGIIYLSEAIGKTELILVTMFYYVCDLICITIWCPFQSLIMKNRCCINCRIFNWGHFMMHTPMMFIRSFFSWSLFFMSILVLIRWELTFLKYPERFWQGSNVALRCSECSEKLCEIKNFTINNKQKHDRSKRQIT